MTMRAKLKMTVNVTVDTNRTGVDHEKAIRDIKENLKGQIHAAYANGDITGDAANSEAEVEFYDTYVEEV